jgi:hypothetical protein
MLKIPWPESDSRVLQDLDILLATATRPNCLATSNAYPTAETIAAAWRDQPEEARYFHENRLASVTTIHDAMILRHLEEGRTGRDR